MTRIARLDAALRRRGQDIILRRTTTPVTDLPVRARVRAYAPDEVTGGILAGDLHVVLSPTGLDAAAWVAAFAASGGVTLAAPFNADARLPKSGDFAIVNGRRRAVQAVMPVHVNDVLVRIEMQVRG